MDFGVGNNNMFFCLNNNNNYSREQNSTNGNGNGYGFTWGDSSWETAATSSSNAFHSVTAEGSVGLANALMFLPQASAHAAVYGGGGDGCGHVQTDPHLTCLKLGKRQYYFEDANGNNKRGRGGASTTSFGAGSSSTSTSVARCQVEGCHVALVNAKEYHRRHKVCEMHSKAPKVVVLGLEQRFCQQCSRFHVVSEFDDSKRSCRRRLAGHNERRRKSSHDSVARKSSQGGCALSLLSSRSDSWLSPADLSIRCSAALRELIAENRAAIMANRQFVSDRDHHWHLHHHLHHHAVEEDYKEIQPAESNYFPQQMFPRTH